jgi:hypothetical protein
MASNLGPGAEFEDEEQHLIDKPNSLLVGPGENYILPPSLWATFWLCDLGRLKDFVKALESTPHLVRGIFDNPISIGESVLKRCMLLSITIRFGACINHMH